MDRITIMIIVKYGLLVLVPILIWIIFAITHTFGLDKRDQKKIDSKREPQSFFNDLNFRKQGTEMYRGLGHVNCSCTIKYDYEELWRFIEKTLRN